MERTYLPMIRHFSAIDGLQQEYTLVYSLDQEADGRCRLTICRTGKDQWIDSRCVAETPEVCYQILRYLCENGVQPEIWQDVVTELTAKEQCGERSGVLV